MRTSVTGEGDDPGRFRFAPGQTISFALGDTLLGEATAKARITPFDLAGIEEEAVGGCEVDTLPDDADPFREVAHLAVLLQTLDTDGDSTAGIEISSEVAALFDGVSIETDQLWRTFQAELEAVLDEARTTGVLPETRTVLEGEEALRALYQGIGLCPASS